MNWVVFILGAVIGGTIGTLFMGLFAASKKENELVIGYDKSNGKDFTTVVKGVRNSHDGFHINQIYFDDPYGARYEENDSNQEALPYDQKEYYQGKSEWKNEFETCPDCGNLELSDDLLRCDVCEKDYCEDCLLIEIDESGSRNKYCNKCLSEMEE